MSDELQDPGEDAVAAAFSSFKADAAQSFPPPSVDEMLMSGPAALKRRRLVSLAAVVGACTAVTAGGFAVAQTLGPLSGGTDSAGQGGVTHEQTEDGETASTQIGDPATPETESAPPTDETSPAPIDEPSMLSIEAPAGDWADACAPGEYEVDLAEQKFEDDSGWENGEAVTGDIDGDGADEVVVPLKCEELTGVAAFKFEESDGERVLRQLGWLWEPDGSQELAGIDPIEDGVITLQMLDAESATWTARYEWDGEAFVAIDDDAPVEPSPSETTETPGPDETQSTEPTPSTDEPS